MGSLEQGQGSLQLLVAAFADGLDGFGDRDGRGNRCKDGLKLRRQVVAKKTAERGMSYPQFAAESPNVTIDSRCAEDPL
jgi:hypothetical protein